MVKQFIYIILLIILGLNPKWLLAQDKFDLNIVPNQEFLIKVLPNEEFSEFHSPLMHIDKDNYMWISGSSILLKYDGYRMEIFSKDIKSALLEFSQTGSVQCIIKDDNTIIWMTSRNGILKVNTSTNDSRYFDYKTIAGLDSSRGIYKFEQIRPYEYLVFHQTIQKSEVGLLKYHHQFDSLSYDPLPISNSQENYYQCLKKMKNNDLWIGTNRELLNYSYQTDLRDSISFKKLKIDCLEGKNAQFRAIEQINENVVCIYAIASDQTTHVFFYNIETNQCNFLNNIDIQIWNRKLVSYADQLVLDANNNLWWSSFGNPIVKYDIPLNFNWTTDSINLKDIDVFKSDTENAFVHDIRYVRSISEDNTGNIWICTNFGLWKHKQEYNHIKKIDLPNSHTNTIVTKSIYDHVRNIYWISTYDGILQYHPESRVFTQVNTSNTSGKLPILCYDITLDSINNLWIASDNGLFSISTDHDNAHFKATHYPIIDQHSTRNATGWLNKDSKGNLYFLLTFGRGVKFNPYTKEYKHLVSSIKEENATRFYVDSNDSIWATTVNQQSHKLTFHNESSDTIYYHSQKKLSDYLIRGVANNSLGELFMMQSGDIIKYDSKTEEKTYISDSYNYNKPYNPHNIIIDNNDNFWLLSHQKLLNLNKQSKLLESYAEPIVKSASGIVSKLYLDNNQLTIPGKGCFYIIDTDKVQQKVNNSCRISNIEINGTTKAEVLKEDDFSYFIKDLAYHENTIEVSFAPYDLGEPKNYKFQYKLEGIDNNWTTTSALGSQRFTQLRPGAYQLKLRASDNGSEWGDQIVQLNFKINSPWFWNAWSKLLYFLLILIPIYWLYRFTLKRKLAEQEAQRLIEMNQLKNRLYTNITHEFRTPLTIILGMTDDMKNEFDNKSEYNKFQKNINMIHRNGQELLQLVNQMLDLAKAESGHLELNLIQANIVSFLNYITESFQSMADSKNVRLTFYPEVDNLIMDFDADKLLSIVSNLLSNAIKFTDEGGKVVLHVSHPTSKEGNQITIKIKDTGIGIPKEEMNQVFDQFYQIDGSSTRAKEGTGIGLALTKELIDLMNGTIALKSELGKGSEFIVRLPIKNNAAFKPDEITIKEQLVTDTKANQKPNTDSFIKSDLPSLLVVEDNPDVATYIAQCLEGKFQIKIVPNGQEGIEQAFEHIPDLIISDVMMPIKDGFELCQTLKNDIRTSHIPIVLLTAKATQQDRITGLSKGADAYLSKPFNKAELFIRIEQLIELRAKLMDRYSSHVIPLETIKKSDEPDTKFIHLAIKSIHTNLDNNDYSSPYLARDLKMSESNVYRKLKALTGKSTAIFIRSIRLHHANDLLKTTSKNVSEVAYDCGFNDPAWFSKVFKEEFGYSPSELRQ